MVRASFASLSFSPEKCTVFSPGNGSNVPRLDAFGAPSSARFEYQCPCSRRLEVFSKTQAFLLQVEIKILVQTSVVHLTRHFVSHFLLRCLLKVTPDA